jgi:hypothetical protein
MCRVVTQHIGFGFKRKSTYRESRVQYQCQLDASWQRNMLLAGIICFRNEHSIQIVPFYMHLCLLHTMKITSIYPVAILLSLLVLSEVAATDERRLKSFVSSLEVVPNFLKDQAIDSVSIVVKATTRGGKLRGKARLSCLLTNAVMDLIFLPGSDMQR